MPTPSQIKRASRKAKYEKIAEEIAINVRAWRDRMGDHQFEMVHKPVQDPTLSSKLFGPQLKTQQFIRTVRRDK